jgi:FtsP/CotA-like multicopper oxidase with cupredoxin domain
LQVFLNLKKMGGYYNFGQPTAGDFFKDVSRVGLGKAIEKRKMWNRSRMSPADFSDVSAATYTYLMNGSPPGDNWTGIARAGERVRLRFIGAGTATYFDVRIPGLKLLVVSTDGQRVEPVEVDEFRIGPGETYDVVVRLPDDRAYTIFAESMDRTGYARGTLAPRVGMAGAVPQLDKPAWLEPVDMMGAMGAMKSGGGHAGHGMAMMGPEPAVHHARTEYSPGVDMRVDYPRTNLDDPGVGLRARERRVLTYADLHTAGGPMDARSPEREIELHLTGNMERFIWSLDGVKLNDAKPIHFRKGERLRVTLHNDTTMTHPMHLHGMWSELETPGQTFQARKHTVSVQPAQRVSLAVTADAPGRWAFHCHLLYHMAAGMFREVVVA